MKYSLIRKSLKVIIIIIPILFQGWGFFGHQHINRLAVFTLPPEMIFFYKRNIDYLSEAAVNPDRRRYAVAEEAPRHFIDLDTYGVTTRLKLMKYWNDAVATNTSDSLMEHGIVPWHIVRMYYQLRDAFLIRDPSAILRCSAEIGHYIADANVPLHTTSNYNGQLTGQYGIHAFWESRMPELFYTEYDFFVGKAEYVTDPQEAAWDAVRRSNRAVDSVLQIEKAISKVQVSSKFGFETKGNQTVKVYSFAYSKKYHDLLDGMVERHMRYSVKMIGDFWFTAWVDAGQPDLRELADYIPTEEELKKRREELEQWKEQLYSPRMHDN